MTERIGPLAAARIAQPEAQRRHRRVLERAGVLDGEVDVDRPVERRCCRPWRVADIGPLYAGDRLGIRGSIGSRACALTPVERSAVDVPSGLWPACFS